MFLIAYFPVTGANQGIGLGVAEVCLINSAKVVYSLDIGDPADEFTTLQAKHRNLKYVRTDVTQKGSIEKAIASIYKQEGHLDGFVANAGMTKHQPALEFDDDQLHKIFELNVGLPRRNMLRNDKILDSPDVLPGLWHLPLCYCSSSVVD